MRNYEMEAIIKTKTTKIIIEFVSFYIHFRRILLI